MVGIKKPPKICQHRSLTTPILIYVSLIIYCSKLGYFRSFVYFNLLIFPDIYDLLSRNIEFSVQHTKVTIRNWVTSCVLTHDFFWMVMQAEDVVASLDFRWQPLC